MALVSRAFESLHITGQLESAASDLDWDKHYLTHELLQQLITLRLLGGEALPLQDVGLLTEPALKGMFQWGHVVHPTTYGRKLKTITWRHNLNLGKISSGLSHLIAKPGKLFITVDSSVCTVHGQKIQGADTGCNPHKPGRNSYHPISAVAIDSRAAVDGYLRPGSCASNDGLDGFVRKIIIERNLPPAKPSEQMSLFDILKGHYEVVVTDLGLKSDNIRRQYNKGAISGAGDRRNQK